MGAVKRDADACLILGDACRIADGVCKDGCVDFIWNEGKIYRCGSGEVVRATRLDARGISSAVGDGGMLRDFGHHAVVLAVAPAADRHVRICRGGREQRRDQRQHEQQQQRDGESTAHE